jgi:signal transduction histidine kinase/ActR/RegA family two-component response regulator
MPKKALRDITARSITLKITLSILVIEAVLLSALGVFYYRRFHAEIDANLEEKMSIPAALMSQMALNFESVTDFSSLEEIVQEEVVDAFITRKDGRIFFSADPSRVGRSFTSFLDDEESFRVSEGVIHNQVFHRPSPAGGSSFSVMSPIVFDDNVLGFLYIKIRADELERQKRNVALLFIFGSLVTIALTTVIEAVWVRHLFVPRISRTTATLRSVEGGDYSVRVHGGGPPDQIGNLINVVNTMIKHVEENASTLQSLTRAGESLAAATRKDEVHSVVLGCIRSNLPVASDRWYRDSEEAGLDPEEAAMLKAGEILVREDTLFVASPVQRAGSPVTALVLERSYDSNRRAGRRFLHTLSRLMYATVTRLQSQERLSLEETRRRFAEAEHRATSTLLEVLEGKNVELNNALEELRNTQDKLVRSEKMAAIGTMAGGVAHDLNNVLSGIVGYPDLLLMRLPEGSDLRHGIEVIKESAARAADVVADLLTLSRGESYNTVIFDINHLVEKFLTSAECKSLSTRFPGVSLSTRLDPHLSHARCSPVHIEKALTNLVTNAFQAAGKDGAVAIATQDVHVGPTEAVAKHVAPGVYVALRVTDSGPGIPKNQLEHVFEPFYTKKLRGRGGAGLGLSVVWNTIEDHNGVAFAESEGLGATFCLYLPSAAAEAHAAVTEDESSFASLKGSGTVLVVDDEKLLRDIASEMLTTLGYSVILADSGEAALSCLEKRKVDLVLLDMLMSGMNGYETCRVIAEKHPEQRTAIISGYSETEDLARARELGVRSFLKKPFTVEQLGYLVKSELQERGDGKDLDTEKDVRKIDAQ